MVVAGAMAAMAETSGMAVKGSQAEGVKSEGAKAEATEGVGPTVGSGAISVASTRTTTSVGRPCCVATRAGLAEPQRWAPAEEAIGTAGVVKAVVSIGAAGIGAAGIGAVGVGVIGIGGAGAIRCGAVGGVAVGIGAGCFSGGCFSSGCF